ncbi:MAG: hypothetical protein R3B06_15555 [Kofleriaceae bacterium]
MGIYQQPNDFTCGPYALKHALTVLGIVADPKHLTRIAKTSWWSGTDEIRLARAARAYGCDMPLVRHHDPASAKQALIANLKAGRPALLCVDNWEHWITIVHHERGRFVGLDSRETPVLVVFEWDKLAERLHMLSEDDDGELVPCYDFLPVKPRKHAKVPAHARFSVARARALRRPEAAALAANWDDYLSDLLEMCRPRSPNHVEAITMAEFLRRNKDALASRVRYWHGEVELADVRRILHNIRFVAETYGLVVPTDRRRQALVDLAIILALWASGSAPIAPFYALKTTKRRRRRGRKT